MTRVPLMAGALGMAMALLSPQSGGHGDKHAARAVSPREWAIACIRAESGQAVLPWRAPPTTPMAAVEREARRYGPGLSPATQFHPFPATLSATDIEGRPIVGVEASFAGAPIWIVAIDHVAFGRGGGLGGPPSEVLLHRFILIVDDTSGRAEVGFGCN